MIEIIKFRIKNYKSIIDSGDCYFSNGITVLAGKNESGKSSILEALEDFDTDKQINQDAIRIQDNPFNPEITLTFNVDSQTIKKIQKDVVVGKKTKKLDVVVCKNFDNRYLLINSKEIFAKTIEMNKNIITRFEKGIKTLEKLLSKMDYSFELDSITNDNYLQIRSEMSSFKENIGEIIPNLSKSNKKTFVVYISSLVTLLDDFVDIQLLETEFIEEFKKYMPNFILFSTYNDQIPNKVSISQLNDNDFISDLIKISNLNIELMQDYSNVRDNRKHKDKVNINVPKEYERFWDQDAANIFLDWDKEFLYVWIKEDEEYYEPKQRSKGRQWHLAFYVKVTARSKDKTPNILLIDEPGLFLHAKAQKNILNKLEESSRDMKIIFSTHSPYLIDADKLNRVRLVERSETEGTKISKIHAKADKETLTPILTAIGEDLSHGIKLDKKNSFIVEGISDYYYLHAFKKLIDSELELNIVPGCGDNIPAIASILFGWGLDPYFILDSDKSTVQNKLSKKLAINEASIINILDEKGSIENVFSEDDFKKYVLDDEDADLSKDFKKSIKDNGGKALVAKQFLEKTEQGKISQEQLSTLTTQNIKTIFEKISQLLKE